MPIVPTMADESGLLSVESLASSKFSSSFDSALSLLSSSLSMIERRVPVFSKTRLETKKPAARTISGFTVGLFLTVCDIPLIVATNMPPPPLLRNDEDEEDS